MEDEKEVKEELELKKQRNEKLTKEIQEIEAGLITTEKQNELLKTEVNELNRQYQSLKQGKAGKSLQLAVNAKRKLELAQKYATGKRNIRELFNKNYKKKRAKKQVKKFTYSLKELGFTKKALADLKELSEKSDNPFTRRLAAWELALWHANQYTEEDAKACLIFLAKALRKEKSQDKIRRAAILAAESHDLLGDTDRARQLILSALNMEKHPDLYLAAASFSSGEERIEFINKVFDWYGSGRISVNEQPEASLYDRLFTEAAEPMSLSVNPKVSIIIPVYNAEKGIKTTLDAVLGQTWKNLEVLVSDDCSTDRTREIVEAYMQKDSRVILLTASENRGAYTARNLALEKATGEYVTINDADDWSHKEKVAVQVRHLIENPEIIANTSRQARATEELKFYRRGKPGSYLFANMSSLMFRRLPAMEKLGYWDSVRFGADAEFKRRLKQVFGKEAVVDLKTAPLSFQRQTEGSLTGSQVFGYHGFFMGARKEYTDSYSAYHLSGQSLYYPFPQETRPFPAPEPMWPEREGKPGGRRHFDVIIASEFRLLGGTNMSNIEEIKAQKKLGLKTGLVQMNRYDFHSETELNPRVREQIDGDQVQMVVYGEKVSCDVLIVRHPPVLQEWQKYIPDIEAHSIRVVINQPPKRDYGEKGGTLYTIGQCADRLEDYFGKRGKWYPIGPQVRETLVNHHGKELKRIKLSSEDWINIIDVEEWKRPGRPVRHDRIRIGRHSRDQYVKWPADKQELLSIYPDSDKYEVYVLGGAGAPKKVLGEIPANWHVYQFGEVEPKDFLSELDVFVYYTHHDWVEAFGRVIFEAMAAGVPVIIPPHYRELFGSAAIYAKPEQVQEEVEALMSDEAAYQQQVRKAQAYVEEKFGYGQHAARLEESRLPSLGKDRQGSGYHG